MTKSQDELAVLDEDSTDIFKTNMIERYMRRPNLIAAIDNLCSTLLQR